VNRMFAGVVRNRPADRIVPYLTGLRLPLGLATAVLTFLGTLMLAIGLTGARLETELGGPGARTATLQIVADGTTIEAEARAALDVLRRTEGVLGVRVMEIEEQRALLEPWLGSEAAVEDLPLPLMIDVRTDPPRLDVAGLESRLETAAPQAILDHHDDFRSALAGAAQGLLIFAAATGAALFAALVALLVVVIRAEVLGSSPALRTLRLVGARDSRISGIFARRMTRRVFIASLAGTAAGLVLLAFLPASSEAGFHLMAIAPRGAAWAMPCLVPVLSTLLAWLVASISLRRALRRWS
jgi:cell division transport system permease protein